MFFSFFRKSFGFSLVLFKIPIGFYLAYEKITICRNVFASNQICVDYNKFRLVTEKLINCLVIKNFDILIIFTILGGNIPVLFSMSIFKAKYLMEPGKTVFYIKNLYLSNLRALHANGKFSSTKVFYLLLGGNKKRKMRQSIFTWFVC